MDLRCCPDNKSDHEQMKTEQKIEPSWTETIEARIKELESKSEKASQWRRAIIEKFTLLFISVVVISSIVAVDRFTSNYFHTRLGEVLESVVNLGGASALAYSLLRPRGLARQLSRLLGVSDRDE